MSRRTPPIDICRGRGQAPLRHAIRISLGWALRTREALWHCLFWGAAIGIMQGWASPPAARLSTFVGCMIIAFGVGYLGPIPWRWRLRRTRSLAELAAFNGPVAFAIGYLLFMASLTGSVVLFHGTQALSAGLLRVFAVISTGGFVYAAIGLYIVTDQDHERAARRFTRAQARQERLAEEARLVALRAQINPHFFFNTLNTIAALIPERPQDAERAVELLATALRPALMRDQPMLATLAEELTVAKAYSEIEQLRLGPRVRFEFSLAPGTASLRVPSLCLQPLVENAVRHGAARTTTPWTITVEATLHNGTARVEVRSSPTERDPASDERQWVEAVSPPGHALHNIGARARALLGPAASLRVRVNPQGPDAVATLTFPAEAPTP